MFSKFLKKNRQGFTVLELVIVSSIMAFLLVLAVANFRGFESNQTIDTEAEKLASVLKQAQIWALTGQTINDKRYAYGVSLTECVVGQPCQYTLFRVNESGDKTYAVGEAVSGGHYGFIKTVYTDQIMLDNESVSSLDIVFMPPLALEAIYFNNSTAHDQATIKLGSNLSSRQTTVTVNRLSGQIDIN